MAAGLSWPTLLAAATFENAVRQHVFFKIFYLFILHLRNNSIFLS